MKKEDIINAYREIRTQNTKIPDDVLDFMKDSAIERLKEIEIKEAVERHFQRMSELGII